MKRYAIVLKPYQITLKTGEQITLDLPTVNPGPIDVRILWDRGGHTGPPTQTLKHLSLGLFYKGKGNSVEQLHTTGTAVAADSFWKVKIENNDPDEEKNLLVWVEYPGPNPILTRTIPLSFFQRAFDEFWNTYRPIENIQLDHQYNNAMDITIPITSPPVPVPTTKLILTLKQEIVDLYEGELRGLDKADGISTKKKIHLDGKKLLIQLPLRIDVPHMDDDVYIRFHDINIKNIRIDVLQNTSLPAFKVAADVECEGPTEVSAHWFPGPAEIKKSMNISRVKFSVQIALTLINPVELPDHNVEAKNLFFKILTEFTLNPHLSLVIDYPGGSYQYDITAAAEGKAKSFVNDMVGKALNSQTKRVAEFLLGENYPITGLRCQNGNIIIDYVGRSNFEDFNPRSDTKPFKAPANLAKVDHIVVVMMENRSFDHMLGYLKLEEGRNDVDGLTGNEFNLDPRGRKIAVNHLTGTQIDESPCHHTMCVTYQIEGRTMKGFVTNFADRYPDRESKWHEVMGYYGKREVPAFNYLANEYSILDRWFCAHPGPTLPNRFITYTGKLDRDRLGNLIYDNYDFSSFTTIETPTVFEYLTRYNVSWKVFEHGYSFIRAFTRHTFNTTNVVPMENEQTGFYALARQGKLPAVSFIEPDYIDVPPGNDDHPPADIARGQSFLSRIIRALQDSPQWEKTMLVITYDEHGGFFDHVVPPLDAPTLGWGITYGPRVPAFVVSPWVPAKSVSNTLFDHTSILTTLRRRFMPPDAKINLGPRVIDRANDLGSLLSLNKPRQRINKIPILEDRMPGNTFRMKPPTRSNNDFHETIFGLRLILGYPPR